MPWEDWTAAAPPVPDVFTHDNRPETFGQDAESTFNLSGTNAAPAVTATAAPASGAAPSACRFDAEGSDDTGDALAYSWTFGDGAAQQGGESAEHTYAQPGAYHATATVRDAEGAEGADTVDVVVAAPPPGLPPGTAPVEVPLAVAPPRTDPGAARPKVVLEVGRRISIRRLLRRGLRYRAGCAPACTVTAELRVSRKTARRHGLRLQLGRTLRGRAVPAGTQRVIVIHASRAVRRPLARVRRLRAQLVSSARAPGGVTRTTRRIVLTR